MKQAGNTAPINIKSEHEIGLPNKDLGGGGEGMVGMVFIEVGVLTKSTSFDYRQGQMDWT